MQAAACSGLRLLLAAQPRLVTPVLQVVHRVITRHLLGQAGRTADEADSGAVTLIQRFGSAANLNIHLHCLVLAGVYRRSADRGRCPGRRTSIRRCAPTSTGSACTPLCAAAQTIAKR